jgi:hypothetical protein
MVFCDQIKHPQTVTFLSKSRVFFHFWTHVCAFKLFLFKYNTFWYTMDYLYIPEQIGDPPIFSLNKIYRKMLDNGYMYQKSILTVS